MPILKDIKISQEINFNGLPTWVSIGGDLLPDEDPKEAIRKVQKIITEYQDEEHKAYSQSRWGRKLVDVPAVSMIEQMDACTELTKDPDKGLLSFELTIKNAEEKAFYDFKLNQLTNKK